MSMSAVGELEWKRYDELRESTSKEMSLVQGPTVNVS